MKEEFGFYIRKTVIKNLLSAHRKKEVEYVCGL